MKTNPHDPIKTLTLSFPHGTSIKNCDKIARIAQAIVNAGVSEGGMRVTSKYGLNVDNPTFSEDEMHYIFGHDRSRKDQNEIQKETN